MRLDTALKSKYKYSLSVPQWKTEQTLNKFLEDKYGYHVVRETTLQSFKEVQINHEG